MLLANFITRESRKHPARFFNRFSGVSDLCSQQFSLWKTIFDEAGVKCPDTFKDMKDGIGNLLAELAGEKTVLIIDAINQLPGGGEMLEWLPKQLPANLKIILSIKTDENETPRAAENVRFSTLKPFSEKEEKHKLINDYLKKYLKALDEGQIDTICSLDGSQNPLYLKVLLSELRVFGSFAGLSQQIGAFGRTPLEAFDAVLRRLESDINSLGIGSEKFVPILFGFLAAARNGLSDDEMTACIAPELGIDRECTLEAVRLFIRQVRPFMARREGRTDYFYDAFKLAARARYADRLPRLNSLQADYFHGQADPDGNLSFKGENLRDFNELPYHLAEAGKMGNLEKVLSTYLWIRRKSELSDIQNVIGDYACIDIEQGENHHLKMLRDALVMSAHTLRENIKDNLPSQLWGRLKETGNLRIKEFLTEIDTHTTYPWLKPMYHMEGAEGALKMVLKGNDGVNSIDTSPDGKYIIARTSGSIRIWDWNKSKEFIKLECPGDSPHTIGSDVVRASDDGKYLLSKSNGKDVHIWDWEKLSIIATLRHSDLVRDACFSPDGNHVVSYTSDEAFYINETFNNGTLHIWDWKKKQDAAVQKTKKESASNICFSSDGKRIFTATTRWNHENIIVSISIWDWKANEMHELIEFESRFVNFCTVCCSPDGKYIAYCSGNLFGSDIFIVDLESRKIITAFEREWNETGFMRFSPDGKYILSGTIVYKEVDYALVHMWDWRTCEDVYTLETGSIDMVTCACFSPDGKYIFTGMSDGTIVILEWEKGRGQIERYQGWINSSSISHDGQYLAWGGTGDYAAIRVQNCKNQDEIHFFKGHDGKGVNSLCFFRSGKYMVSGGDDYTIRVWDTGSNTEVKKLICASANDVCFSADGRYIAAATAWGVLIWEWENSEPLPHHVDWTSISHEHIANKTKVSKIPNIIRDVVKNTWRIWDEEPPVYKENRQNVKSVCFSPDGKYIVFGDDNFSVHVWDLEKHQKIAKLERHTISATKICFSIDGECIFLNSDKGIAIWEWRKQEDIRLLKYSDCGGGFCLSTNGKYLIVGSNDKKLEILDWMNCDKPILSLNVEGTLSSSITSDRNNRIVMVTNRKNVVIYDIENLPDIILPASGIQKKNGFWSRLFKK